MLGLKAKKWAKVSSTARDIASSSLRQVFPSSRLILGASVTRVTAFTMFIACPFVSALASEVAMSDVREVATSSVADRDSSSTQPSLSQSLAAPVPVRVVYVSENQPVQIFDQSGKLLQIVYLKKSK